MSVNEGASLTELNWENNAKARTRKAAEKVALLVDAYYHLKQQIEENQDAVASLTSEKKNRLAKLAALQLQLEKIEKSIQRRQENIGGEMEHIRLIDQLAHPAPALTKSTNKSDPPKKLRLK